MYLKDKNGTLIIKYSRKNNIYFLKSIVNSKHAYKVSVYLKAQSDESHIVFQNDSAYRLWHARIRHMRQKKVKNFYNLTTLSKSIIKKSEYNCEMCQATKIKKFTHHALSEHKKEPLNLVSIDICGLFPAFYSGNTYILEIKDNYIKYSWSKPYKNRKNTVRLLQHWRVETETEINKQFKTVRLDNTLELLATLNDWNKISGVRIDPTVPYTSNQNRVTERLIQTTEANIRAILKKIE